MRNKNAILNILSRDFITSFNLKFDLINAITDEHRIKALINKYENVFRSELGCFKYKKICLQLRPNFKPIFCKPRNLPIAYKEPAEEELKRIKLEPQKIIEPIEVSEWGTVSISIEKRW